MGGRVYIAQGQKRGEVNCTERVVCSPSLASLVKSIWSVYLSSHSLFLTLYNLLKTCQGLPSVIRSKSFIDLQEAGLASLASLILHIQLVCSVPSCHRAFAYAFSLYLNAVPSTPYLVYIYSFADLITFPREPSLTKSDILFCVCMLSWTHISLLQHSSHSYDFMCICGCMSSVCPLNMQG